jgi:hypothetical protein
LEQSTDVAARRSPGASKSHDVLDLGQRQSESPGLSDKGEHRQHIRRVLTVARSGTAGSWQDAAGLVQPQRLAAQTSASRYLADEQSLLHDDRVAPAPWGKVKGFSHRGREGLRPSMGRAFSGDT